MTGSESGDERVHEAGDALDMVDDLLAEEEEARIAALSPAELRAEMAARGIDPARARAIVERVVAMDDVGAGASEPASVSVVSARDVGVSVVSARDMGGTWGRSEGRSRSVWIAVGVAAGLALAAGITERAAIEAWLTPAPAPPLPAPMPTIAPSASPPPEEQAAELRRAALIDCEHGNVGPCERELDAAQELDPAGETEPSVQKARAAIREASHPRPLDGKPRPLDGKPQH